MKSRMIRTICHLVLLVIAATAATSFSAARATPISIGVIGDSLSDEYSPYLGGLVYGDSSALNWVNQLGTNRPAELTFGAFATSASPASPPRPAPRYFGYEYNYARTGASTATAISEGQHTGLAAQPVDYAVLAIGTNDFSRVTISSYSGIPVGLQNVYGPIYNEASSFVGADMATYTSVSDYVDSVVTRYTIILDEIEDAGIPIVMVNLADYASLPGTLTAYPDPVKRQHVTDAVVAVNSQLAAIAADRGLPLVDLFSLAGLLASPDPLAIGGVLLTPGSPSSSNPNYRFLPDGTHPGTVSQGLLGNAILQAINLRYDESLTLQTDFEILANAGLSGSVPGQFDVSPYVIVVPEPKTFVLLLIGAGILGLINAGARRSR